MKRSYPRSVTYSCRSPAESTMCPGPLIGFPLLVLLHHCLWVRLGSRPHGQVNFHSLHALSEVFQGTCSMGLVSWSFTLSSVLMSCNLTDFL